jgi:D-alanyl-D-alanine carboxypeptidase
MGKRMRSLQEGHAAPASEVAPVVRHRGDDAKRRWLVPVALVAVLLAAAALVVNLTVLSSDRGRPQLQGIVDTLVAGPTAVAPGATAYVSDPNGTWAGAAGVADLGAGTPMSPQARMRIASVSKLYLAAAVLQLDQEGVLDTGDTVDRWLPGLLPSGAEITIEHLLTNTSGLIDDNDIVDAFRAGTVETYLRNVKDASLVARFHAATEDLLADPTTEVSPMLFIELAAWQPLLFPPSTDVHHSNIGFNIVGLIAERATGQDLPTLYRDGIFEPLGLQHTAFDPQGPISGAHAKGYEIVDGTVTGDKTAENYGKGADGGIVTDAAELARFLAGLMDGELLDAEHVAQLQQQLFGSGHDSGCAGWVYDAVGTSNAYRVYVNVNSDGSHVTVLMLNGRIVPGDIADAAADGSRALYCDE